MAAYNNEMKALLWEHEAIRAHMRFLMNSLSSLAVPSSRGLQPSTTIKDRIRNYRCGLRDFQDAIQRHIGLDELIFETLLENDSVREKMGEHDKIRQRVDDAMRLADRAVENDLPPEELNQCTLNIREAFQGICELIESHTAEEDRLLKLLPQDS